MKVFDDPLGSEAVAVKADPKTSDVARVPVSPVSQPQGLLCTVCHFLGYQRSLCFVQIYSLIYSLQSVNCNFKVKF